MAGNSIVIVTETGYVTVYPSATSVEPNQPQSTMEPSPTPRGAITMTDLTFSSLKTQVPSMTGSSSTTSPSSTAAGQLTVPPGPRNPLDDALPGLFIATMVLFVLIAVFFIARACYFRRKGKCNDPTCKREHDELQKWKDGDLKIITKNMVKKRESINSMVSVQSYNQEVDLEKQDNNQGDNQGFWWKGKTIFTGKSMTLENTNAQIPHLVSSPMTASNDRFFVVDDEEDDNPKFTGAARTPFYTPASAAEPSSPSSIYSRQINTNSIVGRPFSDHNLPSVPHASWHARADSVAEDDLYVLPSTCYHPSPPVSEAQHVDETYDFSEEARECRSRSYGGLPHPDEFDTLKPTIYTVHETLKPTVYSRPTGNMF